MATTSTIEYTTRRYINDVYPAAERSEPRVRLYNWVYPGGSGNKWKSMNCGLVTQLFANGEDLGAAQANTDDLSTNDHWYYDSSADEVWYYGNTSNKPTDKIMESGEDDSTLFTRLIRRSSRMVESMLDSRMAREIVKDREGNYPEFIQRATAIKVITMMLKSTDPENPVIESFTEEFTQIIEGYRSGNIQLPGSVTADSSKGTIREVTIGSSTDLRLVELKGTYTGSGFDLIKVKVTAGGVIGTSTYSVWIKDSDSLKSQQVRTDEKISGDYDLISSGLYMRFAGDNDAAVTETNDEYEISVWGYDCDVATSHVSNISLTRR